MAHDFNNVLHVIRNYADEIADAARGQPHIVSLVEKLEKATASGCDLARELQELGREQPNRPRVTRLAEVLADVRDMLVTAAGSRVSLTIDAAAPASQIFIDRGQMERVVLNLVLNARDSMPAGGAITIALREVVAAGRGDGVYVVLEVADTGCGMDAATRNRMFEPLFTTKGDKGTGLGLAIVNQAVALAGGFIDVDSAPGQGTRIRLHLPRIA
jgi:two-component system cell cycle sensor histidine kinase/response regulator CckA